MSAGSSLPYRLRPNKAVDRELFLALLVRLDILLDLKRYKYVGLGGPFLEDFRLIHARVGLNQMDCIEVEEAVHHRQEFNKPVSTIKCIHSTLEDYLAKTEFVEPVILWLDYTEPKGLHSQIEAFSDQATSLPVGSVVRVTLNANPASLGKPDPTQIRVAMPGSDPPPSIMKTETEWRLERFKERVADYFPADLSAQDMTFKRFGKAILKAVNLAVEKKLLDNPMRAVQWALATNYSDGQPMVTSTLIVMGKAPDPSVIRAISTWEYYSTPADPLVLDMPALSTLERLTMEGTENPKQKLNFGLPISDMGQDPFEAFKRLYRVFPHFSRVEL